MSAISDFLQGFLSNALDSKNFNQTSTFKKVLQNRSDFSILENHFTVFYEISLKEHKLSILGS